MHFIFIFYFLYKINFSLVNIYILIYSKCGNLIFTWKQVVMSLSVKR